MFAEIYFRFESMSTQEARAVIDLLDARLDDRCNAESAAAKAAEAPALSLTEKPAKTPRKRRTKAEIEAAKSAAAGGSAVAFEPAALD